MSREKSSFDMDVLMNEYGTVLLRLCYLYLGDIQAAEDAVQETFIAVYQNYKQFKGASSEKTWITRIAINVCKNILRSMWTKKVTIGLDNVEQSMEAASDSNAETMFLEKERAGTVSSAIMKLDPKYREVVLLYYYQELNTNEIAKALHIPASTVRIRLARARNKLKKHISMEDEVRE